MRRLFLAMAILTAFTLPVRADLAPADLDKVGISLKEGARFSGDLALRTAEGQKTTLREAMSGKPAMLIFADYTCHTLCGTTIAMTSSALDDSSLTAKDDYRYLVVGLDPKDTAEDARTMKADYLGDGIVGEDAEFLLADAPVVDAMTQAGGYSYAYDEENDQYAHPTAAYVVAPDGRIAQTLTTLGLNAQTVRLALVDAASEKIGNLGDYVRLLCYGYNPATGKYNSLVYGTLKVLAGITVLAMALAFVLLMRRGPSKRSGGLAS